MKAVLKLFNGVIIEKNDKTFKNSNLDFNTIKKGYILDPSIEFYLKPEKIELLKKYITETLVSFQDIAKTFHTAWSQIEAMDETELFFHEFFHYLTTQFSDKTSSYIYIPREEVSLSYTGDIKLLYIKPLNKEDVLQKLKIMITSGVAFKESTIDDIIEAYSDLGADFKYLLSIARNKEFATKVCDLYGLVPKNPIAFLRYLIYSTTGSTLLIKDKKTIEGIKQANPEILWRLFKAYEKDFALENLSLIFFRFKPLFLACKGKGINSKINRIRKLATKYHMPMREDFLNSITAKLKKGENIETNVLKTHLETSNIYRAIRLLNALKTIDSPIKMYQIRNGNVWVKTNTKINEKNNLFIVTQIVINHIVEKLKKNVKDKKVYIPDYIEYMLPSSEKAYVGNIPIGSYISFDKDPIIGVHWSNIKDRRIDLDFSSQDILGNRIGWNAALKTDSVLFSGDITDAPHGATELHYFKKGFQGQYLMMLHTYYPRDLENIPFSLLIGQAKNTKSKAMLEPEEVLFQTSNTIGDKQKTLGLVSMEKNKSKFIFSNMKVRNLRSATASEINKQQIESLLFNLNHMSSLNNFLLLSNAILTKDQKNCDIDLSPENLEKDTILNLLTKDIRSDK